jgi:hypothetical protein
VRHTQHREGKGTPRLESQDEVSAMSVSAAWSRNIRRGTCKTEVGPVCLWLFLLALNYSNILLCRLITEISSQTPNSTFLTDLSLKIPIFCFTTIFSPVEFSFFS